MKKIILSLLLIFLLSNILALGVTPARNTLNYEPNTQKEYSFKVLNTENTKRELVVQVIGDLSQYIHLNQRRINLESGEKEKSVSYKISIPNELPPGLNTAEIIISEAPREITEDDTIIGATLSLVTQVHIHVPYPGKYVDAILNINSVNQNQPVPISISMINKGKADIEKVYANIDIFNENNQKIDTFNTHSTSIKSQGRGQITHQWTNNESVGSYKARVTLIYDGESKTLETNFQIGDKTLELHQITVNNFKLGQIAKMELLVENKWSQKIDKIHTQMQVFDNKGEKIADFKSPDSSIEALTKQILVSYWDTVGLREGTYDAKVLIHSPESSPIETNIQLILKSDSIEVIGLGYVISDANQGFEFSDNLLMIIIIVVVILVLVNVLWFLILRRLMSKLSGLPKK